MSTIKLFTARFQLGSVQDDDFTDLGADWSPQGRQGLTTTPGCPGLTPTSQPQSLPPPLPPAAPPAPAPPSFPVSGDIICLKHSWYYIVYKDLSQHN